MKTDLLFAVPEFLSNPYFSVGFFILMCVFAFLWAMSAHKASNSELDLSVRGSLMTELQSKLNFVNSALELSKRNESQNEAVIKSLRADLSQMKELSAAQELSYAELKIQANSVREQLRLATEQASMAKTVVEILPTGNTKLVKVAAKVPAKRASKPTSKSKATTKPRSLGVED